MDEQQERQDGQALARELPSAESGALLQADMAPARGQKMTDSAQAQAVAAARDAELDAWIEEQLQEEGERPANGSLLSGLLAGAAAGFIATLPMTVMMLLFKLKLPWWQRYSLPPYQITTKALEGLGLKQQTNVPQRHFLSLIMHFGYGAALGAVYVPSARLLPAPAVLKGALYGLLVWVVSYLGWLPVFNVRRSSSEQPQERRLLMIAAHIIWGGVTAIVAARAGKREK